MPAGLPVIDGRLRRLVSPRAAGLVWIPLVVVALLHYFAPEHAHWVHDVARRLYYLPIVAAGVLAGLPGGIVVAVLVLAVYAPHAFFEHVAMDPATHSEKALEMLFYLVLGVTAGWLSERGERERRRQAELTTQLRESLEALQSKDAQLVRAARLEALGQLTAGLAHEIRNPLHAMRGTAEILLDAVPPDAPERPLGARLITEIDRLSGLLSRFLEFARPRPAQVETVDLVGVVHQVRDLLTAQARQQDITLRPLVAEPAVALVRGDTDQVVQVVLGVCINAMQAMGQVGVLEWSVDAQQHGGRPGYRVRIQNDGPPIPEDILDRIFDPFVSGRDEGTGLGLATAARIVEAHGGALSARNQAGGAGVVFALWLPAGAPG